jgi:hypothetical protein
VYRGNDRSTLWWSEYRNAYQNGTYYYRVRGTNQCGDSAWTAGGPLTLCWSAPAPFYISYPAAVAVGSFTVNWSLAYRAEQSHTLQRATNPSFSDAHDLGTFHWSQQHFEEVDLPPGTYYYRVRANTDCRSSPWQEGPALVVNPASLKAAFFSGASVVKAGRPYRYSAYAPAGTCPGIQYQFKWGEPGGRLSAWGAAARNKNWAKPGKYAVRVRARCSGDNPVVSTWSGPYRVRVTASLKSLIH